MTTTIKPGDILLYSGSSLADTLIKDVTNGPYSHAAIAICEDAIIEATVHGVHRAALGNPAKIISTGRLIESARLEYGFEWLNAQLNDEYSYFDIVVDLFKALLPKFVSSTPLLIRPSQYTCSVLAAQFLIVCGFMPLPFEFYSYIFDVSPNDLDRFLKECAN